MARLRGRGDADAQRRLQEQGISSSVAWVEAEFSAARQRFGLDELGKLALEKARDLERFRFVERANAGQIDRSIAEERVGEVLGIAREIREVTSEIIMVYKRRGYGVEQIGLDYQRALGDERFNQAQSSSGGETAPNVVHDVVSVTEGTWRRLHEVVTRDAQTTALSQLTRPGEASIEQRIVEDLEAVWAKKFEDVRLGGRVEDLRSSVGLRTLAALEQRYREGDKHGREEAMPKAYAWAQRAYWLTKHAINQLTQRGEYAGEAEALRGIGRRYEDELGAPGLADSGGIEVGVSGWDVINPAIEKTRDAWRHIKERLKSG